MDENNNLFVIEVELISMVVPVINVGQVKKKINFLFKGLKGIIYEA